MILDADVLIDLIRQRPEALAWLNSLPDSPIAAGLAVMELVFGAQNLVEQKKVQAFLAPFPLAWPTEADLLRALKGFIPLRLAHGNDILDSIVAATAVGLGVPAATFNTKHCRGLPGVTTVQPYIRV